MAAPNRVLTTDSRVLGDGGVDFDAASLALDIGVKFLHVIEAALVLALGLLATRYVKSYFEKIQVAHENQRTALNLLEKLISGFLIVVTVTLALKVIGLDLTLLISSLALGLSFGLKDIIKNYVSGILILFKSPFALGDVVKIKHHTGVVERIDFQATTLRTFDRKEVTIYNKDILSRSIMNYSKDELRRLEIKVIVGRGTDMKKALALFDTILSTHPKVLKDPKFSVVFQQFTNQGMQMLLRFWVKRPVNILKIRSALAFQIEQAFDEVSVYSPYGREVQFTSDHSMSDDRKHRIQAFYQLPELAAIATDTTGKLSALMTEEETIDRDEPEWEETI